MGVIHTGVDNGNQGAACSLKTGEGGLGMNVRTGNGPVGPVGPAVGQAPLLGKQGVIE